MAFKNRQLPHFNSFIILLILQAISFTHGTSVDCGGRPFHCVNTTHFQICVDLGGGMSRTIDTFTIPCPPGTGCSGKNHFECEFLPSTTLTPSDVTNEAVLYWEPIALTTLSPNEVKPELSEKYVNTDTSTLSTLADVAPESTTVNVNYDVTTKSAISSQDINMVAVNGQQGFFPTDQYFPTVDTIIGNTPIDTQTTTDNVLATTDNLVPIWDQNIGTDPSTTIAPDTTTVVPETTNFIIISEAITNGTESYTTQNSLDISTTGIIVDPVILTSPAGEVITNEVPNILDTVIPIQDMIPTTTFDTTAMSVFGLGLTEATPLSSVTDQNYTTTVERNTTNAAVTDLVTETAATDSLILDVKTEPTGVTTNTNLQSATDVGITESNTLTTVTIETATENTYIPLDYFTGDYYFNAITTNAPPINPVNVQDTTTDSVLQTDFSLSTSTLNGQSTIFGPEITTQSNLSDTNVANSVFDNISTVVDVIPANTETQPTEFATQSYLIINNGSSNDFNDGNSPAVAIETTTNGILENAPTTSNILNTNDITTLGNEVGIISTNNENVSALPVDLVTDKTLLDSTITNTTTERHLTATSNNATDIVQVVVTEGVIQTDPAVNTTAGMITEAYTKQQDIVNIYDQSVTIPGIEITTESANAQVTVTLDNTTTGSLNVETPVVNDLTNNLVTNLPITVQNNITTSGHNTSAVTETVQVENSSSSVPSLSIQEGQAANNENLTTLTVTPTEAMVENTLDQLSNTTPYLSEISAGGIIIDQSNIVTNVKGVSTDHTVMIELTTTVPSTIGQYLDTQGPSAANVNNITTTENIIDQSTTNIYHVNNTGNVTIEKINTQDVVSENTTLSDLTQSITTMESTVSLAGNDRQNLSILLDTVQSIELKKATENMLSVVNGIDTASGIDAHNEQHQNTNSVQATVSPFIENSLNTESGVISTSTLTWDKVVEVTTAYGIYNKNEISPTDQPLTEVSTTTNNYDNLLVETTKVMSNAHPTVIVKPNGEIPVADFDINAASNIPPVVDKNNAVLTESAILDTIVLTTEATLTSVTEIQQTDTPIIATTDSFVFTPTIENGGTTLNIVGGDSTVTKKEANSLSVAEVLATPLSLTDVVPTIVITTDGIALPINETSPVELQPTTESYNPTQNTTGTAATQSSITIKNNVIGENGNVIPSQAIMPAPILENAVTDFQATASLDVNSAGSSQAGSPSDSIADPISTPTITFAVANGSKDTSILNTTDSIPQTISIVNTTNNENIGTSIAEPITSVNELVITKTASSSAPTTFIEQQIVNNPGISIPTLLEYVTNPVKTVESTTAEIGITESSTTFTTNYVDQAIITSHGIHTVTNIENNGATANPTTFVTNDIGISKEPIPINTFTSTSSSFQVDQQVINRSKPPIPNVNENVASVTINNIKGTSNVTSAVATESTGITVNAAGSVATQFATSGSTSAPSTILDEQIVSSSTAQTNTNVQNLPSKESISNVHVPISTIPTTSTNSKSTAESAATGLNNAGLIANGPTLPANQASIADTSSINTPTDLNNSVVSGTLSPKIDVIGTPTKESAPIITTTTIPSITSATSVINHPGATKDAVFTVNEPKTYSGQKTIANEQGISGTTNVVHVNHDSQNLTPLVEQVNTNTNTAVTEMTKSNIDITAPTSIVSTNILLNDKKGDIGNGNQSKPISTTPKNIEVHFKPKANVAPKSTNHTLDGKPTPIQPGFSCQNKMRGRYSDKNDCTKFYVCIGYQQPITGKCPGFTVFSEITKQCTKNLAHCVRGNKFKCFTEGRFSDVFSNNRYFICIKRGNTFLRFKLQCQTGYVLNKSIMRCEQIVQYISESLSEDESLEPYIKKTNKHESKIRNNKNHDSRKDNRNRKDNNSSVEAGYKNRQSSSENDFSCEEEGKFADPGNCRKYYLCSKNKKSEFRRKKKKCDSDEVFHKEKKKCVDSDSYQCS